MEIIQIANKELDKRVKSVIAKGREGRVLNAIDPLTNKEVALKCFTWRDSDTLNLKRKIIMRHIEEKGSINIPEFVLPNTQYEVLCDNQEDLRYLPNSSRNTVAFSMDLHKNIRSLRNIMEDKTIPIDKKLDYLKRIGHLLELMENRRKSGQDLFYISDLHEENIGIDEQDNIKLFDMDSVQFSGFETLSSKYLNNHLANVPKYNYNPSHYPYSDFEASYNSDIFCYTIMILNLLLKSHESNCYLPYFNEKVIEYLRTFKAPLEFIEAVKRLYQDGENINPYQILDMLKPFIENTKEKKFSII